MPEVSVDGRRISYLSGPDAVDASKLAIIMIHGSGGDGKDWSYQVEGLSGPFGVIAIDLPGHGGSEPPAETSVEAYAKRVEGFVRALGLSKVFLIGCSLGSAITQWLGLEKPEWLAGLGIVGGGARLKVLPAFLEGLAKGSENSLESFAGFAVSEGASEQVKGNVLEKLRSAPPGTLVGDLTACNEFDVLDRISAIDLPTCIVVGENDRLTPVKYSKFISDRVKGSQMSVVPNAGHLVMIEQPDEFNRIVAKFAVDMIN